MYIKNAVKVFVVLYMMPFEMSPLCSLLACSLCDCYLWHLHTGYTCHFSYTTQRHFPAVQLLTSLKQQLGVFEVRGCNSFRSQEHAAEITSNNRLVLPNTMQLAGETTGCIYTSLEHAQLFKLLLALYC